MTTTRQRLIANGTIKPAPAKPKPPGVVAERLKDDRPADLKALAGKTL